MLVYKRRRAPVKAARRTTLNYDMAKSQRNYITKNHMMAGRAFVVAKEVCDYRNCDIFYTVVTI